MSLIPFVRFMYRYDIAFNAVVLKLDFALFIDFGTLSPPYFMILASFLYRQSSHL